MGEPAPPGGLVYVGRDSGAHRFGSGAFGEPIPVRRRDELGQLASDVNAMATSIHQMLEAKRGLLLAISHELRSPLTRARLNTELLPETGDVAPRREALLRNLLDNALRHSAGAAQPPSLHLRRQTTADGGQGVEITVRDFGPGVDAEALPHLAEPFYRPDSARGRSAGGVGLGLYLCKLVAQAHGGSLALRNAQPGLEVTVTLG